MENLVKQEPLVIVDSDEIDTLDTLLSYDFPTDEKHDEISPEDCHQEKYNSLEKISLEDIPYLIFNEHNTDIEESNLGDYTVYTENGIEKNTEEFIENRTKESVADSNFEISNDSDDLFENRFKNDSYQNCINNLNSEYAETLKNDLLEPLELLSKLEDLREKSRQTVKKLRELKTTCEQAIIDIEHKIEFEDFGVSEGYKYAMIIKELRNKRRFIKNTLDKYDSVSSTLDTLDKSLGKNFIKSQIKTINKVSKIQSSRQYTPRVLKKLAITGKSNTKNTLDNLEVQIESILENANM